MMELVRSCVCNQHGMDGDVLGATGFMAGASVGPLWPMVPEYLYLPWLLQESGDAKTHQRRREHACTAP